MALTFAMEFLTQQNRRNGNEPIGPVDPILATGKHVLVIGGGDTGFRLHRHIDPSKGRQGHAD